MNIIYILPTFFCQFSFPQCHVSSLYFLPKQKEPYSHPDNKYAAALGARRFVQSSLEKNNAANILDWIRINC